jgi:hypothetical protein
MVLIIFHDDKLGNHMLIQSSPSVTLLFEATYCLSTNWDRLKKTRKFSVRIDVYIWSNSLQVDRNTSLRELVLLVSLDYFV